MVKSSLPPGFRFRPSHVELVVYYLKRKVLGKKLHFDIISELDIYKYSPRDLPDFSILKTGDLRWYFFCPREKKYANGARTNRATEAGYWKTTGNDRPVKYDGHVVGMIKTLVFHLGRAPQGRRTDWVMHEYRLQDASLANDVVQDSYVLSVVFQKGGPGPRNGEEYGAPFREEYWEDSEDGDVEFPPLGLPAEVLGSVNNQVGSTLTCTPGAEVRQSVITSETPGKTTPPADGVGVQTLEIDSVAPPAEAPVPGDDILLMLNWFKEDANLVAVDNDRVENVQEGNSKGTVGSEPCREEHDIYVGLEELGNPLSFAGWNEDVASRWTNPYNNIAFLELADLERPLVNCNVSGTINDLPFDGVQAQFGNLSNQIHPVPGGDGGVSTVDYSTLTRSYSGFTDTGHYGLGG
ncbi:NAC domain, partial [Dillenia turbinata]